MSGVKLAAFAAAAILLLSTAVPAYAQDAAAGAAKVIAATGNYGEIFDRTLGRTFGLERGLNALWTQGGLMRPMPMR